jgi:hypothetical protein
MSGYTRRKACCHFIDPGFPFSPAQSNKDLFKSRTCIWRKIIRVEKKLLTAVHTEIKLRFSQWQENLRKPAIIKFQ